ncbi:PRC-barrel domain-containing protein [Actibacterium ureilyticum]|uniref:PRC-barrel domain-containing protein n=1 Tax=Actibacterium ureilyticum TaxID=1590614 RepID=UPI000BAAD632|nr:PRC-barrel domain-containing protein [Actibacterium ureilyticum]
MHKFLLSTALVGMTATAASAETMTGMFHDTADPSAQFHASEFIGQRVYRLDEVQGTDSEGVQADWDDIGEINDIIIARDGSVDAILVDIGGFLGIGEKQVAVDMGALEFVSDSSTEDNPNDYFLVMSAPSAALEEAPVYDMGMDNMQDDARMTTETETEEMAGVQSEQVPANTPEDVTAEMLTGAPIYDANEKHVGEVSELILGSEGQIQAAIVDVGGFLGIGEKPVELGIDQLEIAHTGEDNTLTAHTSLTKAQLEEMPEYEG